MSPDTIGLSTTDKETPALHVPQRIRFGMAGGVAAAVPNRS